MSRWVGGLLLALGAVFLGCADDGAVPAAGAGGNGDTATQNLVDLSAGDELIRAAATRPVPRPKPLPCVAGWYRGNLHTHSFWSDGDDFPEHISLWYRESGYDFLAISDHNTMQQGEKWVKYLDLYKKGAGPAIERYLRTYPHARTRGDRAKGTQEIRLTPFNEYRKLIEVPGKYLLIPSEELSDKFEKKPIHINATNVAETIKPKGGKSVVEVIRNNFRAIQEQAARLNRPILPHLNHPNFQWGVTAEEMAEVLEDRFFEVYNGHPGVNQPGDPAKGKPPIERMWDVANSLRMTSFKAPPMMGLGTDDTHHYHVGGMSRSAPGRGWIYVRAKELSAEALIAAMQAGDFYASCGVVLRDVRYEAKERTLTVTIEPDGAATYVTEFVGTRAGAGSKPGEPKAGEVGAVFAKVEGTKAVYKLTGDELYVRARVTSSVAPDSPSFKGQKRQAWTQPVGWEKWLGGK